MTFPKQMRWDAYLDDGKGELPFGRPIRWILFLYGGRVVPFAIRRTQLAQGPRVQDIRSGAITYGHRFLTTSGRAGRASRSRPSTTTASGCRELRRSSSAASATIASRRELDAEARRRGGRVARSLVGAGAAARSAGPRRVSRSSSSGTFADEFLQLPEEVLTTTMIHHQHYFPVVERSGQAAAGVPRRAQHGAGAAGDDRAQLGARADGAAARRAVLLGRRSQAAARRQRRAAGHGPVPQEAGQLSRESGARRRAGGVDRGRRVQDAGSRGARRAKPGGCARPTSPPTWCASSPSCRARWAASTRARTGCPKRSGRRSTSTTCRSASKPTRRRRASSSARPR